MHFIISILYSIFGIILTISTLTLLTLPGIIDHERKYYKLASLYVTQQLPETFENPTTTNNTVDKAQYIFAGYNDIYDYLISKELVSILNKSQELAANNKPTAILDESILFEDIPRIYIYIAKGAPHKVNLIFSKLRKSEALINLANNTILAAGGLESVKSESNKVINPVNVPERVSIDDTSYTNISNLIKKHNINQINISFDKYARDIQTYIGNMSLVDPEHLTNLVLTPGEKTMLGLTSDSSPYNKFMVNTTAGITLQMNPGYNLLVAGTANQTPDITFTNLLTRPGLEFNFVFDSAIQKYLLDTANNALESQAKQFIFKNPALGTNISQERLALFKSNVVNSYILNIFYILKDYTGNLELSNKELTNKLDKILIPELTPEKLEMVKEKAAINKDTRVSILPDKYFYLMYNSFQITKVYIKQKESDL